MEILAPRVFLMLEDEDVLEAVRLAAINEIVAPYCQSTGNELVSTYPHAVSLPQYTLELH
jgi:hypothetical protein